MTGHVLNRSPSAQAGMVANVRRNSIEPLPPGPVDPIRKDRCRDSLRAFLETYFPDTFELGWSPDHLLMIEDIEQRIRFGGLKAIAFPRGSGKTSILLRAALWAVLYGYRKFVSFIAANEEMAVSNLTTIKTEINHNALLAADFALELHCLKLLGNEPRRTTSQHYQGIHTGVEYSTRRIDFGTIPGVNCATTGAIISAVGITGAVRGQHKTTVAGLVARPDFLLVDDPQTKSSASSKSQCDKRHGIMMGDALGMAGPGVSISGFCTCTVIYKGDVADRILDNQLSPDWDGMKVSMIKRWPTWMDGWDQYNMLRAQDIQNGTSEAKKFVRANYKRLHEDSEVYWEDRKEKSDVSALQHAMDLFYRDQGVFSAEYQNAPVSASTTPPYEINPERLMRRTIGLPRARVPTDTKLLTAFVDTQKDIFYYVVMAWGKDGRGYVIDYGACPDQNRHHWSKGTINRTLASVYGDDFETYIRGGLSWLTTALMETDYVAEDNSVHQIAKVAIDARWGESTHIVRKFVRESKYRARLHPSMGMFIGASSRPWQKLKIEKGEKKGVHAKLIAPKEIGQKELMYDTNYWKSFAADRLTCSDASPKAIMLFHAPPHEHRMFAEHCAYERCVAVLGKNENMVTEWKQDRLGGTVENDYWDCLVGNCALASILGVQTHVGNNGSNLGAISDTIQKLLKGKKTFRGL